MFYESTSVDCIDEMVFSSSHPARKHHLYRSNQKAAHWSKRIQVARFQKCRMIDLQSPLNTKRPSWLLDAIWSEFLAVHDASARIFIHERRCKAQSRERHWITTSPNHKRKGLHRALTSRHQLGFLQWETSYYGRRTENGLTQRSGYEVMQCKGQALSETNLFNWLFSREKARNREEMSLFHRE